jgi:hypothetical protein
MAALTEAVSRRKSLPPLAPLPPLASPAGAAASGNLSLVTRTPRKSTGSIESSSGAGRALQWWEGTVDEAENQRAFQEARMAFLAGTTVAPTDNIVTVPVPVHAALSPVHKTFDASPDVWNAASAALLEREPSWLRSASRASSASRVEALKRQRVACFVCFRTIDQNDALVVQPISNPGPLTSWTPQAVRLCSQECAARHADDQQMALERRRLIEMSKTVLPSPAGDHDRSSAVTMHSEDSLIHAEMVHSTTQSAATTPSGRVWSQPAQERGSCEDLPQEQKLDRACDSFSRSWNDRDDAEMTSEALEATVLDGHLIVPAAMAGAQRPLVEFPDDDDD